MSKAEVNTLLDQKDRWQQEQWMAAPDDSLDFSAVVVKFKSLVGGEHLVVCGAHFSTGI